MNNESDFLAQGLRHLTPLLEDAGFTICPGDSAVSSGGPFSSCLIRKGTFEIGLVVRDEKSLGCPNYSIGEGYVGHDELMRELGFSDHAHLIPGDWLTFVARDRGDPFLALAHDLRSYVLPVVAESESQISSILSDVFVARNAKYKRG